MYQCEIVCFAGFDFIFDNFGANALGSLSLSYTLTLFAPHSCACALFFDAVRMTHAMMCVTTCIFVCMCVCTLAKINAKSRILAKVETAPTQSTQYLFMNQEC